MSKTDFGWLVRGQIASRMLRRRKRAPIADIDRVPRPDGRPHPDAQWNEAAGRWEVWNERQKAWICVETRSTQPPAQRSVDPLDESLVEPARMDLHPD